MFFPISVSGFFGYIFCYTTETNTEYYRMPTAIETLKKKKTSVCLPAESLDLRERAGVPTVQSAVLLETSSRSAVRFPELQPFPTWSPFQPWLCPPCLTSVPSLFPN